MRTVHCEAENKKTTIKVIILFMGRMKGIEPSAFGTTTRRSNQLSYIRHTIYLNCKELGDVDIFSWLERTLKVYLLVVRLGQQLSYIRHIYPSTLVVNRIHCTRL